MHLNHPERLVFSPHIAWYSREARARLAHEMAENIRSSVILGLVPGISMPPGGLPDVF